MGSTARKLKVLDAGCGRNLHLRYAGLNLREAHVIGIDVSQAVLDENEMVAEKIQGDLQTYPLESHSFDVVICQDVLEHLSDPKAALANMAQALRPGGELVLAWSNPGSLKGLATKFTPHWFHVWVYKRGWFGFRYRGLDGPPFKTYLRWSLRPRVLRQTLGELGFDALKLELQVHPAFRWGPRFARLSECRVRAIKGL